MNSTITGTILNDEYGGDGNDDNATQETQDDKDDKGRLKEEWLRRKSKFEKKCDDKIVSDEAKRRQRAENRQQPQPNVNLVITLSRDCSWS